MPDREHEHEEGADPRPSLRKRLSRRILGEEDGKSLLSEARDAASEMVEGVKARPEVVRLIAREVRSYLDELGLKDDLRKLLTNYSVELKASIHLRRLAEPDLAPEGGARAEKPSSDRASADQPLSADAAPTRADPARTRA